MSQPRYSRRDAPRGASRPAGSASVHHSTGRNQTKSHRTALPVARTAAPVQSAGCTRCGGLKFHNRSRRPVQELQTQAAARACQLRNRLPRAGGGLPGLRSPNVTIAHLTEGNEATLALVPKHEAHAAKALDQGEAACGDKLGV